MWKNIKYLKPEAVFCYAHLYAVFQINKNKDIKYIAIQNGKNQNSLFSVFDKKKITKILNVTFFFCHGEYDKKFAKN